MDANLKKNVMTARIISQTFAILEKLPNWDGRR